MTASRPVRGRAFPGLTIVALLFACASPELVRSPSVSSPEPDTFIRGVDVFTGIPGKPVLRAQDVLLRGGRVARIGPGLAVVPGLRVMEGRGRTLLPGLVDFHTHVRGGMIVPWKPLMAPTFAFNLQAALYSGIVAIVDLGGDRTAAMRAHSRALAEGRLLGPRLFAAGKGFTVRDGHPRRMGELIRSSVPCIVHPLLPELGASISDGWEEFQEHLAARPDFTKIYLDRIPLTAGLISQAKLDEMVQRSHKSGVRVVVHVGEAANLRAIVQAGADGAAHIVYKDEIPEALAEDVARAGMFVVPTLVVWDNIYHLLGRKSIAEITNIEWESMPPGRRAAMRNRGALPKAGKDWQEYNQALFRGNRNIFKNTAALKKAGVLILAGSDSPNLGLGIGGSLHRELQLLVRAGLTPTEALLAATSAPARVLGREKEFGTVAVGLSADLILVAGDPTKDIRNTQRIEAVFYRGVLLHRLPPKP